MRVQDWNVRVVATPFRRYARYVTAKWNMCCRAKRRIIEIPISSNNFILLICDACSLRNSFLHQFDFFLSSPLSTHSQCNRCRRRSNFCRQPTFYPNAVPAAWVDVRCGIESICSWTLEWGETFCIKNKVSENKFQFISLGFHRNEQLHFILISLWLFFSVCSVSKRHFP